tara:strand:- start:11753 stop:12697 length:945 start_codon:yes stop_codon:yes gene_type:complete
MDKKIGQPKANPKDLPVCDFTIYDDAIQQFSDAIFRHLGVFITPVANGVIHRVDDPDGRPGNLACWYVCHLDGVPTCTFGNWRTGERCSQSTGGSYSGVAARGLRVDAIARNNRRKAARLSAQEQAKLKAKAMWESAPPATVYHPYLAKKSVPALNVREQGGWLLVPLYDTSGELVNIQRIDRNGNKRFLKDGRITGCFGLVGAPALPESGRLYIAEGWATAATIHGQTRCPVAAAMNCGNLKPTALALHAILPDIDLIVAADNDHRTPANPGMAKATEAAQAVGGGLVWPQRCNHACTCTDFNDVANCREGKS